MPSDWHSAQDPSLATEGQGTQGPKIDSAATALGVRSFSPQSPALTPARPYPSSSVRPVSSSATHLLPPALNHSSVHAQAGFDSVRLPNYWSLTDLVLQHSSNLSLPYSLDQKKRCSRSSLYNHLNPSLNSFHCHYFAVFTTTISRSCVCYFDNIIRAITTSST